MIKGVVSDYGLSNTFATQKATLGKNMKKIVIVIKLLSSFQRKLTSN